MKAGIYKTPNGNLIYVAKDRTIKATTLSPSSWPGMKVSHRAKDDTVSFLDYRCTRVADVPNGCTDHQALVDSMHMAAHLEPGQRVVDYGMKFARVEAGADDPYKRVAEHMRGCEKAMRHVGEAAVRPTSAAHSLSAPYGRDFTEQQSLASFGFRRCHKASARKHRRRGDQVIALGDGRFAWAPKGTGQEAGR